MSEKKRYSKSVRIVCGILGLAGVAAIAFCYLKTGELSLGFMLFAPLFAIFLFIYVAIWSVNPIEDKLKKRGISASL